MCPNVLSKGLVSVSCCCCFHVSQEVQQIKKLIFIQLLCLHTYSRTPAINCFAMRRNENIMVCSETRCQPRFYKESFVTIYVTCSVQVCQTLSEATVKKLGKISKYNFLRSKLLSCHQRKKQRIRNNCPNVNIRILKFVSLLRHTNLFYKEIDNWLSPSPVMWRQPWISQTKQPLFTQFTYPESPSAYEWRSFSV